MKEYQNYLFDLYGTLVDIHTDEENDILWKRMCVLLRADSVFYSPAELRAKYLTMVAEEESRAQKIRGTGAEIDIGNIFESFYAKENIPVDDQKIAQVAQIFRMLSLEKLRLFPGVIHLLETLRKRNKDIYLLSNAQALFTLPELRALGLEQYFDGIIISSCEGYKKPSETLYHIAMERYALCASQSVMIGNDDRADCWGAANVGLDSMYIQTEQSPTLIHPLPQNCRVLNSITEVL